MPVFTAELLLPGRDAAVGTGSSKRAAEQAAANVFLRREGLAS
jgi:dsRNA-specific ribonuclease